MSADQVIKNLKLKSRVDFRFKKAKDIVSRMPVMKNLAVECKDKEDYENAYIFCQRYLICYDWLKNLKRRDKQFDVRYTSRNVEKSDVDFVQKTLKSLNQLITEKCNKSVEMMQIDEDDVSSLLPDTPTDEPVSLELEEIKCLELYNLEKNKKLRTLIIDVRTVDDFKHNAINITPKIINIPPSEILPGKSSTSIEKYLKSRDPKMLQLYQNRDKSHIDTIVIVDYTRSQSPQVTNLFNIFKDWDIGRKFGRIAALSGGFEAWTHTYPMEVTNSLANVTLRETTTDLTKDSTLSNITYGEFLTFDENKVMTPTPVAHSTRAFSQYNNSDLTPQTPNETNTITLPNITPIAKKTVHFQLDNGFGTNDVKKIPAVDRSNKPIIVKVESPPIITVKEQYLECYKNYYRAKKELVDQERKQREEGSQSMQIDLEISKRERALAAEKDVLKIKMDKLSELKLPITAEYKRRIDHLDLEIGDISKKLKELELARIAFLKEKETELVHKEPLKADGFYGNSSLKRSHSSPNLAKVKRLKTEEQIIERKMPHVDRSLKPQTFQPSPNIENRRLSMSVSERENRMEPVIRSGNYPGITGLKNLGNSCYMNSIIQCLSNTAKLAKYFYDDAYQDDLNDRNRNNLQQGQVVEEVAQVIKALWRGHYKSFTPRDLKTVIGQYKMQFENYDQQDSHEFLIFLLDWMHNDLKKESPRREKYLSNAEKEWYKATSNQTSVISELFFGQLRSTVRCNTCENNSTTYEIFNSLTMSLSQASRCTLDDCIKRYVSGQKITEWKCPHCKVPRDAVKKFDFVKLSPIIVIHLNRFGESDGWLEKKNTAVDFPLTDFNLEQYVVREGTSNNNRQYSYNLYAMSNHSGTMDGGHYTAYCKNATQDKWYKYDDHTVTDVPKSQVKSQTTSAYLLFYSSLPDRACMEKYM